LACNVTVLAGQAAIFCDDKTNRFGPAFKPGRDIRSHLIAFHMA
jgi:hypothetical protein